MILRRAACYLALPCLALAISACSEQPDMPFGTPQQFMANQVQPAAQTYWMAVRYESELMADGTIEERDIQPQSDAEWEEVRAAAAQVSDYGELMLSPAYSNGREQDWSDMAQSMIVMADRAEQAAIAQDANAVFEMGGLLYSSCEACHEVYPPAILPQGVTLEDLEAGEPH